MLIIDLHFLIPAVIAQIFILTAELVISTGTQTNQANAEIETQPVTVKTKMYSIPKEPKYTAAFLLINNETQYVPLLFLSSRFMTYNPSSILGKLFLEKTSLNLGSSLK